MSEVKTVSSVRPGQQVILGSKMSTPINVRVEYNIETTVNTGNFQNVKPGYKVSADVPDGVHPSEVRAKLKALADAWLEEDVDEIRKGE